MRGSSGNRRTTTPLMPGVGSIVIAYDAMRNRNIQELKGIINDVLKREEMTEDVSTIILLGVLDKVLHPLGFEIQIRDASFIGAHARAIEEEVSTKVDANVSMLQHIAEECEEQGIEIQVKIVVGAPKKNVLVEQVLALQATWAVLDRQLRKELRFYLKHIPCKVALVSDDLQLEVLRRYYIDMSIDTVNHKLLYSLSKPVPPPPAQDDESDKPSFIPLPITPMRRSEVPKGVISSSMSLPKEQHASLNDESVLNPQQEASDGKHGNKHDGFPQVIEKERSVQNHSEEPVVSTARATKTGQDAERSSYSEMQIEPGEYSSDTSPEEGNDANGENKHDKIYFDATVAGAADDIETGLESLGCRYSNIERATDNFSSHNFLGEGGFGVVYKGKLKDGRRIAVKVQMEANMQKSAEFHSEVYALSFARHANIVTLLGYCFKENLNILIYEYISNKSLEWHLFDNAGQVLEWQHRRDIAIGTAKGLRFLHEECRGSPIVHRDIRPSNILLTHDFIPLLGDCGLAKWKTYKSDKQRRSLGNLVYLAPEDAESGVSSVKTDVYAFGILLIQLISGRKAVESTGENHQQSIRQWALSLIRTLALQDLVDPRIGDAYCTYDLYNMARAAYVCTQTKPAFRPTMGEVLCILEGTNDHLRHVNSNLYPMIISEDASLS